MEYSVAPSSARMCDMLDEVLSLIFDHLDVLDLKSASLVCRRWAKVTFAGRRMKRLCLKVDAEARDRTVAQDFSEVLLKSTRNYRHVVFARNGTWCPTYFLQLLRKLTGSIQTLQVFPEWSLSLHDLKLLLLEVPYLQRLSLRSELRHGYFVDVGRKPGQGEWLPVLKKLKHLQLARDSGWLRCDAFSVRTIAPHLERLVMDCHSEHALDVYRHFSGQLKSVEVVFVQSDYFTRFSEVPFPCLEELDCYCDERTLPFTDNGTVESACSFFRRLSKLRQ
ncbi:uncharacterized protein LOC131215236, partial [Anopheles bellator]|uniref:uncharacterized protein LOC131215236 n=1 Tax=Anopheles bellator TaxID=139047 RepID=UPI002649523A